MCDLTVDVSDSCCCILLSFLWWLICSFFHPCISSLAHSVSQSVSHSVSQSVGQSVTRSVSQSVGQSATQSVIQSFSHSSLIRLFVRSFIHLICSFVRSFVRSFLRSLARSLGRSFVRSFVRSSIHSAECQTSTKEFVLKSLLLIPCLFSWFPFRSIPPMIQNHSWQAVRVRLADQPTATSWLKRLEVWVVHFYRLYRSTRIFLKLQILFISIQFVDVVVQYHVDVWKLEEKHVQCDSVFFFLFFAKEGIFGDQIVAWHFQHWHFVKLVAGRLRGTSQSSPRLTCWKTRHAIYAWYPWLKLFCEGNCLNDLCFQ